MPSHLSILVASACMAMSAFAAGENITPSELDHARLYLQQVQDGVIGATKGLTPAQWNFKPAPDRWSIAETVEHIVLAQELFLGPVRQQLAQSPETGTADRRIDAIIESRMPDRTAKFKAPDVIRPTGRWTPAVAMERLVNNDARLKDLLETTPDLRQHTVDSLPLKALSGGAYEKMDGYQWILTVIAHAERHTKQILEVKADPNFPLK